MKKRLISQLALGLVLMLVMNNCRDHGNPFPQNPDAGALAAIDAIELAPVTLVQPEAVSVTPSSIALSAKTTQMLTALDALSTSTLAPVLQQNADMLTAVLTASELDALAAISPTTLSEIAAGGGVPANQKAIMDKVAANPALQAFLPVFVLPTVAGKTLSGSRDGVLEDIEKSEGIAVEDACVQKAQEKYQEKKDKLEEKYGTQKAGVDASYTAVVTPLAAQETSCKSGIPAKYNALRAAAQAQAVQSLASLESAKGILPPALYATLKALTNLVTLQYLTSLNQLQSADLKACSDTTLAQTAAAAAARDTNKAALKKSYDEAIAKLEENRIKAIQSCHNQGGGK